MYKRYKNYITSSDDFVNNDNNNDKPKVDININKPKEEEKKFEVNKNKSIQKNENEEKINIKKVIICELCDKRLDSRQDYLLHMSSKSHKYKMKELLRKELKECGSIKKVLIKEKLIAPYRRWKINNIRYLLYGFALNRYINK